MQCDQPTDGSDCDRPIAPFAGISPAGAVERLIANGRLDPPASDALALGDPLAPVCGAPAPTEILAWLRAAER